MKQFPMSKLVNRKRKTHWIKTIYTTFEIPYITIFSFVYQCCLFFFLFYLTILTLNLIIFECLICPNTQRDVYYRVPIVVAVILLSVIVLVIVILYKRKSKYI